MRFTVNVGAGAFRPRSSGWLSRLLARRRRPRPRIHLVGPILAEPPHGTSGPPDVFGQRLGFVWKLTLIFMCLVVLRLFSVQVIGYGKYARIARRQHLDSYELPAARGAIYDREGKALAVSQEGAAVYMVPKYFFRKREKIWKDLEAVCAALNVSAKFVYQEARKKPFLWLKRPASPEELERVREVCQKMKIAGVGWESLCLRYYPAGKTACHVLGFTNDKGEGLEGVERSFNSYLYRKGTKMSVLKDSKGQIIFTSGGPTEGARSNSSLTLTIDAGMQHIAERELERGVERARAAWGCAIVMEVSTGEVLAMANSPRFSPGDFQSVPAKWRINHSIGTVFEPGSTFKLVPLAAALQENVVQEETVFYCEHGAFILGKETIHDVESYGDLTVADMFTHSSNVGFAKLGIKLGGDPLYNWARRFGFGEKTSVGISGEERGILRKYSDKLSVAAMSFGHGVGVTALQLAAAYAAIANDGVLMRPFVVREVRDERGRLRISNRPTAVRRIVSPSVARRITGMLETAVEEGTGRAALISGYRVAGKTGTALKSSSRGYAPDSNRIVTFVGFLPADSPRLLILVVMDSRWGQGGGIAGPVFREIGFAAMRQYGVPGSVPGALAFLRQSDLTP